jgi:TPR repeat protein
MNVTIASLVARTRQINGDFGCGALAATWDIQHRVEIKVLHEQRLLTAFVQRASSFLEISPQTTKLGSMELMGLNRIFGMFVVALIPLTNGAFAQNSLRGTLITGLGDVATIKRDAEAGNAKAQVALGDSLLANFHSAEALGWYRKAAAQGDTEGAYQTGHLLLLGRVGIPKEQIVQADPTEGIRWTFQAATNFHPYALQDMSRAFQRGLGVSTNWIHAYAWQQLFAETQPGSIVGKVELNQLALKLDTAVIEQA